MGEYYTKAINEYIKFLLFGSSFLIIAIKTIFPFIVNNRYYEVFIYIPSCLMVCVRVYEFIANIINKINYNKYLPKISFIYL